MPSQKKMAKKGQRMTRGRAEASRPMSPPPINQPPQENDLTASPRVLKIKEENLQGLHMEIKIEAAEVDDELDVKPDPDDATIIKQEVIHKCATCKKTFANKKYLAKHMKTHNANRKKFSCQKCDKSYISYVGLYKHRKTAHSAVAKEIAKPHKCPKCDNRYAFKHQLKRHMTMHQEKKFRCDTCKKLFRTKNERTLHRERMHSLNKNIPCSKCKKMFSSERLLKDHLRIYHEREKLKCIFCEQSFINNRDMHNHLRTHTHEKPFLCERCGKDFSSKRIRDKHEKNHKMEHKCPECSRLFASHYNLKIHCKYVHQEKRWSCVFCGKPFGTKESLNAHLVRKIGEKRFTCEKCLESFATPSDRCQHVKRCQAELKKIKSVAQITKF